MAPDGTPPTVDGRLDAIRERSAMRARLGGVGADPADFRLLLGAIVAVLEDHRPGRAVILGRLCRRHENHRYFSITSTEADGVRACPDCTATVYSACTGCGQQVSADACPVRSTIGRELAGKDSSDEK